jgi:tetratricopeptide (TPR) repeat protein
MNPLRVNRELLFLAAFAATSAHADDLRCFSPGLDADARIAACTQSLNAGTLVPETRALTLMARAAAYAARDPAKALADYDAAFALAPPDAAALLARGKLQRDPLKADADYTAALMQNNTLFEAYALRGALRLQTDPPAGIADLGEARRLNPTDPIPFKCAALTF